MNEIQRTADLFRLLAERLEAGEFESVDTTMVAGSRERTPSQADGVTHEPTGTEVLMFVLQKARKDG